MKIARAANGWRDSRWQAGDYVLLAGDGADGLELWSGDRLLLEQILPFNPSNLDRGTELFIDISPQRNGMRHKVSYLMLGTRTCALVSLLKIYHSPHSAYAASGTKLVLADYVRATGTKI